MQGFLRHIVIFSCVMLLTQVFVTGFHKQDMTFDPIDTEDNAMIKQGVAASMFNEDQNLNEHTKSNTFYTEHKGGKKDRDVKFLSFEFTIRAAEKVNYPQSSIAVLRPRRNERYAYLFYKEINPPPPKSC